ncbi:MAG: hypothetical protein CME62_10905 [Halobacteriovoraceae bacterium]|nr:hypothetical protein [Halobacteriovoraceae bacterium]|tara:strand:- start:7227 stop:8162 length:936 start_codon:yes stop_codon:yes gene_type:complete
MKTIKHFSLLTFLLLAMASCTQTSDQSNGGDDNSGGGTGFGICGCAANTPQGSTCTGTDGTTQCSGTLPAGGNCACASSTPIGQTCSNGVGGTCNGTYNPGSTGGGGNCTGTTSDGTGAGTAIHHFDMLLAGHQSWKPGTYSDPLASSTMPTVQESMYLFRSDNRLKVRMKVNPQPYPAKDDEYCYGRNTGSVADAFNYTKLKYEVHLRDVKCDNIDSTNPNNCLSGWYLGPRYRRQIIGPIGENNCSNQIDLGSMRNNTPYGTVIEVSDVKSDSTCQYNDTHCPSEDYVRTASCWHMTLQIVTDYTQDFK